MLIQIMMKNRVSSERLCWKSFKAIDQQRISNFLILGLLCCSVTKLCLTLCDPMDCNMPGFPILHYILEFAQTHVRWVGDAIQAFQLLPSPSSPALNLSSIMVFSSVLTLLIRWQKYCSFSFNISPSNEYSSLIAFRINWFELFAVQEPLKSLFQLHSSKTLILQHSTFSMVQLSHLYMTTGKIIALTIWIFVCKVVSLFFNTLSSPPPPPKSKLLSILC